MTSKGGLRVCVLGAGVVGLTTATLLQETRPDLQVTLCADRFTSETVSDVAAGLFKPTLSSFSGPDLETTQKWATDSFEFYKKLLELPEAIEIGIKELGCVALSSKEEFHVKNSLIEKIIPIRKLSPKELEQYSGGDWKHGSYFKTLLTENRRYLPYLMKKFQEGGGKVEKRSVKRLEDLSPEFDAVFNCTGLGAYFLCNDPKLTPMKGQVIRVKAPWVKDAHYADSHCYIIPGIEFVTLGGLRQLSDWSLDVNKHVGNDIWEKCVKAMPSLRNAEILEERAGLRPYRPVVRVEAETLSTPSGTLKVVHNYGHGGYGVCVAPGCSMHAVRLMQDLLPPQNWQARL